MSPHFIKNNKDMIEAAERCIELRQFLPALVLIYSHIDTLAWAGSTKETRNVRRNFETWVSRWLIPELSVDSPSLTATDLYAARCGVLHSLTSKSDLSSAGEAKEVCYAWGNAKASILDSALSTTVFSGKLVTVHVEALLNGLREAIAKFIEAADTDPSLRTNLEEAAGKHYMNISTNRPSSKNDG
jgi:hypothetical protein